jgi:cell division protein FtsI/penicillin-binding protein 2
VNSAHAWRFNLIGTLFSLFAAVIVGQLVLIQTNPDTVAKFREWNAIYEGWSKTVYPARGEIYDRWGHLLAGNTTIYEVGVTRSEVQNPHTIALTLNVVLGLDYNTVFNSIDPQATNGGVYVVLDDFVPQERVERLQALADEMSKAYAGSREKDPPSLAGLSFQPHLMRSYPEKSLASNLLGFVGGEGHGFFGVEAKFDSLLAGQPTQVWMPNDPNLAERLPEIPEGASLILTIDREIQRAMEAVVDDAIDETGAESATLVVMDPIRGEILAMATTPRLDLNEYWNYGKVFPDSTPFNRAISQDYEPGSVFKVLTLAAGLDSGAIQPETTFLDTGVFEIGGTLIYNWNGGAWGPQDMQGCMQHSLNVCLAWIASQTGAKNFYAYMNAFGIGHVTGVDMAGEVTGRLKAPGDSDWYDADLGTNSFGQGVSATPLQMAAAVSALANEGKLFTPRIVRSIVNDGHQFDTEPQLIGMPIKPETARAATEMLARSLEEEASDALVEGYRLAGKTGTAEIPTPYGYTSNVTNTSFVGWGPVDDPRFVVYVWLEKPQTSIWGSEVAAPVFAQAVNELVVLMDLPPDAVRQQLMGN